MLASFPFSPAKNDDGSSELHYSQHFDVTGDCREEVVIYNEKAVWVYENPESFSGECAYQEGLPNTRLKRASFYSGFQ